jgi:N-acetylglucosaminyldiphosphoundecaprenol N-acetyl-beta-D-mannosaminyltransferase
MVYRRDQDRICLLGIPVNNLQMKNSVDSILSRLDGGPPAWVAFVNANCANIAYQNPEYRRILSNADYVFADGIGMRLAGRWLGQPLRDNVNGTDLFPLLCARLAHTPHRLFLLGGRSGVADRVKQWVQTLYPDVIVCGTCDGFFSAEESPEIVRRIRESRTDLLLVGLGAPAQEIWIAKNLAGTNARVAIGVGGLFDFYGGQVRRAPKWVRKINLEWLFRLLQEPDRLWRRYLIGNPVFLWRVFRARSRHE